MLFQSRLPIILAATLAATCFVGSTEAQPSRSTGNYGKPTYANPGFGAVGREIRHSRDYVRSVQQYTADPQAVTVYGPEDSQEALRSIQKAQKNLELLKKDAAKEKDILTRLTSIEKHLAAAEVEQKKMHEECCKESPDGKKTMECCNACMKHLDAAEKEHAELMKKINPKGVKDDHDHKDHEEKK